MHSALAVALVAGATLALPASRPARPATPHAPAARALTQEPKKAGKQEPHPEIDRALKRLQEAKADLEKAAHDYGGHRVAAIKSIDEAVGHLHEALNFDKK